MPIFSVFVVCNPAARSILCGMFQSWPVKVCIRTSVFRYFNKIDKIVFPAIEKKFSNDFVLFPSGDYQRTKE